MSPDSPASYSQLLEKAAETKDFSDRFSPVFVRDIRRGLRSDFFVWTFIITHALALLSSLAEWSIVQFFGNGGFGGIFSGIFTTVLSLVFSLVLPLAMFNALTPEIGQGRNVELLLTSNLRRWQIVRGKLYVGLSLCSLLLFSLLPYVLIRYFLGGVELFATLRIIVIVLAVYTVAASIVIGASGFQSTAGRVFLILGVGFSSLILLSSVTIPAMTGKLSSGVFLFFTSILTVAVIVVFSLQVGRARLKVAENPMEPPSSALVFVVLFLLPIVNLIVASIAGAIGSAILLALTLVLGLWMDQDPPAKENLSTEES